MKPMSRKGRPTTMLVHLSMVSLFLTVFLPSSHSFTTMPGASNNHHIPPSIPARTSSSHWYDATKQVVSSSTALKYGEGRGVDSQLLFDTWEWTANLGAPAALVAGAVLATMVESRQDLSPRKNDSAVVRNTKKMTRFLLLTSFGLEIISIFVTTITGTMLLSHGDAPVLKNLDFSSPMGFLMNNWEFEYLTSRITFLQGLFHWLASVALELLIPKPKEGVAARRMNHFTSSALFTILIGMISFLNRHMTFYRNYGHMLRRYFAVVVRTFLWPPRPMTLVLLPLSIWSSYLGVRAFLTSADEEEEDDDEHANVHNPHQQPEPSSS